MPCPLPSQQRLLLRDHLADLAGAPGVVDCAHVANLLLGRSCHDSDGVQGISEGSQHVVLERKWYDLPIALDERKNHPLAMCHAPAEAHEKYFKRLLLLWI